MVLRDFIFFLIKHQHDNLMFSMHAGIPRSAAERYRGGTSGAVEHFLRATVGDVNALRNKGAIVI